MKPLLLTLLLSQVPARSQPAAESQQPCAVLKRMGPADQITSHFYAFGIRGKQFQFVEGQLPKGAKFHGRLTDHDVRKIQDAGGKVVIVDAHYTVQELDQARKSCASSAQPPTVRGSAASQIQATPAAPAAAAQAVTQPSSSPEASTVVLKSTPDGAEITVDGKYVGSTPSTLKLAPGDHTISIEKAAFKTWQRTVTLSAGGSVSINATLEKAP
jgi:hypothetical protein